MGLMRVHVLLSKMPELLAELSEVSWLRFIEESEMSERRCDEERVEEVEGEAAWWGLRPYSAK